jgi:diadenylate cyclase
MPAGNGRLRLADIAVTNITLIDVLDVTVLAVLIYQVLIILQRTRATQLIMGVFYFAVLFFLAYILHMAATLWVFERLVIIIPVALLILFQPELRSFFERAGRRSFPLRMPTTGQREYEEQIIETVAQALEEMSEERTGALIVIEREMSLNEYINTGERIDAQVRKDLLKAIFYKGNPLHDGAVIIRGDRVASARSFLPLSESHDIPSHLGTRHRAALGITEVSDAISLVASEETGHLSLFHAGRPAFRLTPVTLRHLATEIILPEIERETPLYQLRENLGRFGFRSRRAPDARKATAAKATPDPLVDLSIEAENTEEPQESPEREEVQE